MEFSFSPLLWSIFNLFLIVVIICFLYFAYKKFVNKENLQYQYYKEINAKLDELIRLNKNVYTKKESY